ncbi:hypothetical protein ACODYM_28965 [Burkholderia gladioli]|uniref:hypothetical protein n=1 Tax=Burkholderia gladioli TaxID=28095 RepID=UPI003B5129E4
MQATQSPSVYIEHTHKGFATAHPQPTGASPSTMEIFRYAVEAYGFLVSMGERIDPREWVLRIRGAYGSEPRALACIKAIHCVMGA